MDDFISSLKFDDRGLIPVIAQDCRTDEVLMLAYMDAEALQKTIETGKVHYHSRSRQKLWLKGETSGHFQHVRSISFDCDSDALLVKVEQTGAACHTGHHSCFYRKLDAEGLAANSGEEGCPDKTAENSRPDKAENSYDECGPEVLREVYDVIADRVANPKEGSYTNYLFQKGIDKILKKIGEEASEVIIAAKNGTGDEIKGEIADLFYHIMVLLVERKMTLEDVCSELKERR